LLQRFAGLHDALDVKVSPAAALGILSGRLAESRVGLDQQGDELQIRGWLDLPLDDSPAMVICGLNHPFVPAPITSDPFLPGSLRSKLRVSDNQRRLARDIYALQVILASRPHVKLIVGKTATDGSPTPPSRLIAAAPAEDVARRIRVLSSGNRQGFQINHVWDNGVNETRLPVPSVEVDECPVRSMSVTSFKAYLECPYRFYLRHVLKMKPVDDSSRELAANQFGDLVHAALENFGTSSQKDLTDPDQIYEALRHHLHAYAGQQWGDHVESAVRMQIRQAERRLQHVANEQAKRMSEGWVIYDTETEVEQSGESGIVVDGKRMAVRGRIDRIDRHSGTGQWAILDYKTHGHKPEKKHLRFDPDTGTAKWIDLQLPIYRMMIPQLGIDADPKQVQLGYFNVSDKEKETCVNIADFSETLMEQAEQLIRDLVRRIFACDFAPTTDEVAYDDYGMILQTGVSGHLLHDAAVAVEGGQED